MTCASNISGFNFDAVHPSKTNNQKLGCREIVRWALSIFVSIPILVSIRRYFVANRFFFSILLELIMSIRQCCLIFHVVKAKSSKKNASKWKCYQNSGLHIFYLINNNGIRIDLPKFHCSRKHRFKHEPFRLWIFVKSMKFELKIYFNKSHNTFENFKSSSIIARQNTLGNPKLI